MMGFWPEFVDCVMTLACLVESLNFSISCRSLYEFPGATIVYCPSRKMTEEVFSVLQGEKSISCCYSCFICFPVLSHPQLACR